jgi:TPR repeat protein
MNLAALVVILGTVTAALGCNVPYDCAHGDVADCERVRSAGSAAEVAGVAAALRDRCEHSNLGDSEHACIETGRLYRDLPSLRALPGDADFIAYRAFSRACYHLSRPRGCVQLARALRAMVDLPATALPRRTVDPNAPFMERLEAARRAATTACDGQIADGCFILGEMSERGEGGSQDLPLAARTYEKAASLGVAEANIRRCLLEHYGWPSSPERRAAVAACGAACEHDEQGFLCARHAHLLDFGADACPSLQRACTKGRYEHCQTLGDQCAWGRSSPPIDRGLAVLAYRTACQHGHPETCVPWISALIAPGADSTNRMLIEARTEAHALCRQYLAGMPDACVFSGRLHRDVEPADLAITREDFDVACGAGNGSACRAIADDLVRHRELNGLPEEIREYYRRGCDLRDVLACHEYGVRTLRSARDPRGLATASRILTRSCRQSGHAPSCLPMIDAWLRQRRIGESRVALAQFCIREVQEAIVVPSPPTSPYRGACALHSQMLHDARSGVTDTLRRAGYATACERESWVSCMWLAELEEGGVGGAAEPASADGHYQAACDHAEGYRPLAQACTELGILRNSNPRYSDQRVQRTLFERACSFDDPAGCASLAGILSISTRPEDLTRARSLFVRGCAGPGPDNVTGFCCHNLSLMEQAGRGGAVDLVAAAEHERWASLHLP